MANGLRADSQRYNLPALREAARITYAAFRDLPTYIVIGIGERQLAWRMGRLLERHGSQHRAFPVIAAFGEQAAEPHHVPTQRKLKLGDMVKVDAGAVYNVMRGDVTRTYFVGTPNKMFTRRYQAVYTAQQKAFPHYIVGNTGQYIDNIARSHLRSKGLQELFIHSLGHGVGRAIHQPPWITPSSRGTRQLRQGEVITNEPGIYESGWGGIRIEDMVEVTARGPRWLGKAPSQLRDIIIT